MRKQKLTERGSGITSSMLREAIATGERSLVIWRGNPNYIRNLWLHLGGDPQLLTVRSPGMARDISRSIPRNQIYWDHYAQKESSDG
jgi:hypothetical protein